MAQGQTSFAPIIKYDMQQNPQPLETCTYGINGSIRKRYDHQTQNTDYYYFNAFGNLKACGTDMQISVYGYNSANTRTYKVNMFNANQWVNGHPQPIQPMVQSAMFYPNTYINFTQAGEYTKHYYNGTERIASRLGEQQVPVSVENEQELEAYKQDVKQIIYNAIGQHLYDEPTDMQEGDVIPLEFLQATGDNNAIFYYHPNHLASTMYVTDVQQSVVQSFLYAPYGDIISEYNPGFNGNVLPNYAFNAKELDEETDMYYYEARYYKPPVFTSRDPMFEKYFWMTPYAYCANNPVKYVDPDGCASILPDPIKKSISKAITTSAEYAHALYNRAASIVQSHPQWISKVNRSLSSIKKGVEKVTDMNPKTMGWLDLTNIWLFELGNTSEYTFGPEANTTKQLMKQTGVEQARETAHNNIKNGKFGIINHPWSYDTEQFYEGMSEGNAVTSFLGSYTTTVNITPGKNAGEFILNFEVKNTSSWESATRLRKDNDGNGNHDGIIPSKERGVGIHLGGNLRQTWKWSEPFSVN